jgi:hypothetical protein
MPLHELPQNFWTPENVKYEAARDLDGCRMLKLLESGKISLDEDDYLAYLEKMPKETEFFVT